jgi:hypothetical protein
VARSRTNAPTCEKGAGRLGTGRTTHEALIRHEKEKEMAASVLVVVGCPGIREVLRDALRLHGWTVIQTVEHDGPGGGVA